MVPKVLTCWTLCSSSEVESSLLERVGVRRSADFDVLENDIGQPAIGDHSNCDESKHGDVRGFKSVVLHCGKVAGR